MLLKNDFSLPLPPESAFGALLDLERVAACMPGAQLSGTSGDDYLGTIQLKVGPIKASYEGTVRIAETDAAGLKAVLQATGREVDGHGSAEASIRAGVTAEGNGSRVRIETDLNVQGRAAQFGRGVLGEVTQRIIEQFAQNLEAELLGPAGSAAGEQVTTAPEPATDNGSLDAWQVIVLPQLKKSAPQIAVTAIGVLIGMLLGRATCRRRHGTRDASGHGARAAAGPDRWS